MEIVCLRGKKPSTLGHQLRKQIKVIDLCHNCKREFEKGELEIEHTIPVCLGGDIRKYVRYNSKKPSFCITGDMRKVFHPFQNRALTVRELARLQTYPDEFIFEGSKISQQQQVGNSVPPLLAEEIANQIGGMLT